MPTLKTRQPDFTAGEWSRTLGARVDVDKYNRGADTVENFLIMQGGGLRRRPGTRHQGIALAQCRLIPFVFSEAEAFVIEMTAGLFRFYTSAGRIESPPGTPVEVIHTYNFDELPTVKWTPSGDILFLTHPNHPTAQLERLIADGTRWRLHDTPFVITPSLEFGTRSTVSVTPGATSGSGVTFTASGPFFLDSDAAFNVIVRRLLVVDGPSVGASVVIRTFTNSTHVVGDIEQPFASTAPIPAGSWKLDGSPISKVTPGAKSPVGLVTTLTADVPTWRTEDVGKMVLLDGGAFLITGFTSNVIVAVNIQSEATSVVQAPQGAWTLEEPAFSPLNGYPACSAFAEDRFWLFATPRQPLTFWASKSSDFYNFAQGTLDDDALTGTLNSDTVNPIRWALPYLRGLMLGTAGEEWVIDAGEGNTLTPSSIAQAVKPTTSYPTSTRVRPIKIGDVILFATRSRLKLRELAPDPQAITTSKYVAPDMTLLTEHLTAPVRINAVTQTRRFVELAWQREPQQVVWGCREDGTLLSFSYIREQNVTGWCRHILNPWGVLDGDGRQIPGATGGRVESVCVIPHADDDRDQVWLAVARTIGGITVRHVETLEDQGVVFDDGFVLDAAVTADGQVQDLPLTLSDETGLANFTTDFPFFTVGMVGQEIRHVSSGARAVITAFHTDFFVEGTITVPFTGLSPTIAAGQWGLALDVIGGLSHLEGRTVSIVGDGALYPDQVVVGGAVGLVGGPPAMKIEAGLGYRSRLKTLRPEVAGLGTVQGRQKRTVRMVLRLFKSLGGTVNGKLIIDRRGADPLGTGVPLFSGDKDLANLGWDTDGQNEVEQRDPLPLTLLGLFPLLSTDD